MTRHFQLAGAALAILLTTVGAARAATVIDQSAGVDIPDMSQFPNPSAQSFQQSAGNVAGAGIYLTPLMNAAPTLVTISLWSGMPHAPGSTELASGSATSGLAAGWLDVFWAPTPVVPNTTLFLDFTAPAGHYLLAGNFNAYAHGQVFTSGHSYPDFDYAFRTYADTAFSATPEPVAWALTIVGFGAAGAMLRRRRMATAS